MSDFILPKFNIIISQPRAPSGAPLPYHSEEDLGNELVRIHGLVVAILADEETGIIKSVHETKNLVLDAGDLYYSECGVAATQQSNFTTASTPFPFDGVMEVFKSVSVAPTKAANRSGMTGKAAPSTGSGSSKVIDSGFPKVNDTDTDNTGKGTDVLTYKVSYTAADWSDASAIDDVDITNPSPTSTDAMLMWADGLAVTKSASDTLVIYVNHTFNGV